MSRISPIMSVYLISMIGNDFRRGDEPIIQSNPAKMNCASTLVNSRARASSIRHQMENQIVSDMYLSKITCRMRQDTVSVLRTLQSNKKKDLDDKPPSLLLPEILGGGTIGRN
jgi:hypothetical protein